MNRDLHAEEAEAAWGWPSKSESRWQAQFAIFVAIALYFVLPSKLVEHLGPRWLVPALEVALCIALITVNPKQITGEVPKIRIAAIILIGLINFVNFVSLGELIRALLYGTTRVNGRQLIIASVPIWLTNVIVFGLWYWELDRGGPAKRLRRRPSPTRLPLPTDVRARVCGSGMGSEISPTTCIRRSQMPLPSARPTRCHSRHGPSY